MSKPINTCVLGVGLAGLTFHVPFILALPRLFTLHSVLERNPKVLGGKVAQRFGVTPKIHRSIEDVLSDTDVELVVVATPNDTHYPFTKAALNAGKHVLVDKPVAESLEQAKELGDLAKSKGLVLYAYQNRRWDSDFLALKRLISLPENHPEYIGPILEFESHFDRYRKALKGTWKDQPLPGSGILYDLGAHLLDQALNLFGRPDSITAFVQNVRGIGDPNVDDSFTIRLQYGRSAARQYPLAVILRSHPLSVRSPQIRFIVRGTQGTYIKHGIDTQEEHLKMISSPNAILKDDFGREPEYLNGRIEKLLVDDESIVQTSWPTPDAGAYIELFQNLGAVIRAGSEPAVKWDEASAVIELIELAHESSRKGVTIQLSPPS
ncbi:oxidoreductase [Coprinopsis cinerea okayama7|uniref:Oxidoreductase n=1 Tax=Coprinopsis cinerea (strain Okayama-7 / 130 / ATCC MYA-4618 / FGSC 9003) TaxID=240176 RepID=A8NXY2_COPC7|nr:oxidoreductase [Coprinopsis cinerea okayama7\|eukprot:XP_001837302.1 oxidoreductase [Coprinopsis cinerea okayama7\